MDGKLIEKEEDKEKEKEKCDPDVVPFVAQMEDLQRQSQQS